jgi:hypothetical protein
MEMKDDEEVPDKDQVSMDEVAASDSSESKLNENNEEGDAPSLKVVGKKKRRPRKKRQRAGTKSTRARVTRSFPASTFEEALTLAQAIDHIAAGQQVRRLTLFDKLGKSPDSGATRQLITNSSKYGLTKGSYVAEHLELTSDGRLAVSGDVSQRDRLQSRFRLAIRQIPPFNALYERFKGNKLPAHAVLRDFLVDQGSSTAEVQECVDTFILNAKFLGLLRTVSGAERLLPMEHVLEEIPSVGTSSVLVGQQDDGRQDQVSGSSTLRSTPDQNDWQKICFYITPIGDDASEQRRHSDLFLSTLVEPALAEFDLTVVRADQIGKPGMITAQVIEYIVRSRLVISDLSYHNPNVFYELALRHACRLPTVQLIRVADLIPFDLEQFRTIRVDTTDIYSLVPKLDVYRSEIAAQVRQVLSDPDAVDNPVSVFFPYLSVEIRDGTAFVPQVVSETPNQPSKRATA